jgi:hypothetical protein
MAFHHHGSPDGLSDGEVRLACSLSPVASGVRARRTPMANFGRNGVVWNWDVPQLEALTVPAATGGTSNDAYGLVIGSVPDLRHGFLPKTLAEGV